MRSLILADWLLQYLEKGSGEPINRQIYRLVQRAILSGRLATGAKLPSSRALAKELGVARNTIVEVYDQLMAEGYVESSAGSGTYIADTTPDRIEGAIPRGDGALLREARKSLSIRGELLMRMARVGQYQWGAFMPGLPDISEFPVKIWNRIQGRIWSRPRPQLMTYAPSGGYRPLRRALAEYLRVARSVNCSPEQVVVTTGIHQSIDLAVRLLSDPKDGAWIEEPCYWGAVFIGSHPDSDPFGRGGP